MAHRDVARARETFLSGADPEHVVRPTIARSWRRAQHLQVSTTSATPSFARDLDPEPPLVRAAAPVLRELADQLASGTCGVLLADADARIRWRWSSERSVMRALDTVGSAAGASLAEVDVGTNGLGTVIEERGALYVQWAEHYAEMYQPFVCAGAPIWSLHHDRIEGVVTLVSLDDRHGRMLRLAQSTARQIEQRLARARRSDAHALLDALTAVTARSSEPIAVVNDRLLLASDTASEMIDAAMAQRLLVLDRQLRDGVSSDTRPGDVAVALGVDAEPVLRHGRPIGTLFRLSATKPSEASRRDGRRLPGLDGDAAAWLRAQELARQHVLSGRRLLIEGERGVGKLALARALVAAEVTPGPLSVADSGLEPLLGTAPWLLELSSMLTRPGSVVLRCPEGLSSRAVGAAAALLDRRTREGAVVVTSQRAADVDPRLRDRVAAAPVVIPPLRARRDDVMVLLAADDRRRAAHHPVAFTREARHLLERYAWPGNVRELQRVAEEVRVRVRDRQVTVDDLPTGLREDRSLHGELAALERQAIIRALRASQGNRTQAARTLGIARSTLYRKARALGVPLPRPD